MTQIHPAALPTDQLLMDCEIKKTRRGGPGGQHRNKTDSAIVITHLPTAIVGQAGERRSQHENRAMAIERLRLNLAVEIRNKVVPKQQPTDAWIGRVRGGKLSISPTHDDFPALMAEALDFIRAAQFDVPSAADRLGVSNSQLIKFVKLLPPAFRWLNENRLRAGMKVLK